MTTAQRHKLNRHERKGTRSNDKTSSVRGKDRVLSELQSELAPFPIHAFPVVLQHYIRRAHTAIGCDPSYIALPLLAALARTICNKRSIHVRTGWEEPAIIWGAIISGSGEHKTPALAAATRYLGRQQRIRDDLPQVRYTSSDATFPGVRDCLWRQLDSSLLLMPDELIEVFSSLGRGGQSALKKGHWLTFWSGKDLITHRYKQETCIPRAAVSIVGGIQPEALRQALAGERHFDDGLVARFLLTWRPPLGPSQWTDETIGCHLELYEVFAMLEHLDAPLSKDGFYVPQPIYLSEEARELFIDFYDRHNRQAHKQSPSLRAAFKKLEAYAARFALILELVSWASTEFNRNQPKNPEAERLSISQQSMAWALELVEWFKGEAVRVYQFLNETPADRQRRELVDTIQRHGGEITVRELMRVMTSLNSAEKAHAVLQDLQRQKLITRLAARSGQHGGRPTSKYRLIHNSDANSD